MNMNYLKLASILVSEKFGSGPATRIPEPEMVMNETEQVDAYASSGRRDGIMAAANLFHAARVCSVIADCRKVLDLGCGPATQLAQIARLNPDKRFIGIELSPRMLDSGKAYVAELSLDNVDLRKGDITTLEGHADGSIDAVISTMTLHHLPTLEHLDQCFAQIRRVLRPGGSVYIADFGRLNGEPSVQFFSHLHAHTLPQAVVVDYVHSMRAAFSQAEFKDVAQRHFGDNLQVVSTFGAPFMVIVKSSDNPVTEQQRALFQEARTTLSSEFAAELNNLRLFFRLGGLGADPFH